MSRPHLLPVAGAALLVALLASLLAGPRPPSLADAPASGDTGDRVLAQRVRSVFGDGRGHRGVAVAVVEPGGAVRYAGVGRSGDPGRPGVDRTTRFEIGSVTKGLTGLLIAEQVRQGRASLSQPFGRARLQDLATHSAGMPRLPTRAALTALPTALDGGDPYTGSAADVLADALRAGPHRGAPPKYSNLGAAAAGDLLARDAGTSYAQLLTSRVLEPLGMRSTVVVTGSGALPQPRAVGSAPSGAARSPWRASGWAPAGIGVWSTTGDLARLVGALATGSAPGQDALTPRRAFTSGHRIGLFWITTEVDGHTVVLHNGETGGMSAFVGLEPSTGRGVVVLSNTSEFIDHQALDLLLGTAP